MTFAGTVTKRVSPSLRKLPHRFTIMENYCSGWPLQVSTWARASSHASTARHTQWKARAAIDEPL